MSDFVLSGLPPGAGRDLFASSFSTPLLIFGLAMLVVAGLIAVLRGHLVSRPREERQLSRWDRPFIDGGPILAGVLAAGVIVTGILLLVFHDRQPLLAPAAAGAVLLVLALVASVATYVPYDMPIRPRRVLQGTPSTRPTQRIFMGWGRGYTGGTCWALGRTEDSVGVVGPPRWGKTLGVIIPNVLLWGGSVVATSVKPDIIESTHWSRKAAARRSARGGRVLLYNPYERDPQCGVSPACWSPLHGCEEVKTANRRVRLLIDTAIASDKSLQGEAYWREGASRILVPLFHAGACHPSRPGDFRAVRRWLDDLRGGANDVTSLLRDLGTPAGAQMAATLEAVLGTVASKELASYVNLAHNCLRATEDPTVLASCSRTDIDPDEFLTTDSTLYVVAPTTDQQLVAPLIVALIDSLISRCYALHAAGQLPARVLFALDELANIAPLPEMDRLLSQGASQGVSVLWAVQNYPQLRACYGDAPADAIWGATSAKLVLGGLDDHQFCEAVSATVGEERVRTVTEHSPSSSSGLFGGESNPLSFASSSSSGGGGGQRRETGWTWRRKLMPHQIRQIPFGWGLLLAPRQPAMIVGLRMAARQFRRLMEPPKVA